MVPKEVFKKRREVLVQAIKTKYGVGDGLVLITANFELENIKFAQNSTFYYYTGCHEPACALVIDLKDTSSTLFVPETNGVRSKWFKACARVDYSYAVCVGVDGVRALGEPPRGYSLALLHAPEHIKNLVDILKRACVHKMPVFTCAPEHDARYLQQHIFLNRLSLVIPELQKNIFDVSGLVAAQRCIKEPAELSCMRCALCMTYEVQKTVENFCTSDQTEALLFGKICAAFWGCGFELAFDPIVACGSNSCFAHHVSDSQALQAGDLVVVDCGARSEGYCADITRTFVVGGRMSKRQKEVYDVVEHAQKFVLACAKPGMFLNNPAEPSKSLNHLMKDFFAQAGYGYAVVHGIGHFLGLDVHDVGDPAAPLQENMVITIEPGLYLPDEGIGVRIEDDFVITKDGAKNLDAI